MNDATLSIPEIHCDHCKMSIEGAVAALDGVTVASVDVPSTTLAVSFDDPTTITDIIGAVEEQGYEVPAQT